MNNQRAGCGAQGIRARALVPRSFIPVLRLGPFPLSSIRNNEMERMQLLPLLHNWFFI